MNEATTEAAIDYDRVGNAPLLPGHYVPVFTEDYAEVAFTVPLLSEVKQFMGPADARSMDGRWFETHYCDEDTFTERLQTFFNQPGLYSVEWRRRPHKTVREDGTPCIRLRFVLHFAGELLWA